VVLVAACSGPDPGPALGAPTGGRLGAPAGGELVPAPAPDPRISDVSGAWREGATPLLPHRRLAFGAMGTDVTIEALGPDVDVLDAALLAAEAELRRVEDLMTSWRDSPLTRLNARAGEGLVPVEPELARLIGRGLAVGELTEGAFDVTFASVGKLWDFKAQPPVLPTPEQVTAALAAVDYRRVELVLGEDGSATVALPAGTRLGLGGIAKGYGVDRAMAVLLERGIEHGVVNAGGDMKVLGRNQGATWRIAIKHPREPERVLAAVPLSNTCMVTSGDYERFFELDGLRYHHILDPRTGYPATGAISATVLAPDAAFADALATALSVLPPEEGCALVEGLERVECLIVGLDGEVTRSSGLGGLGDE
jgi:thiamine biosynthesis lipoprotein